jgi:hypothetical protein
MRSARFRCGLNATARAAAGRVIRRLSSTLPSVGDLVHTPADLLGCSQEDRRATVAQLFQLMHFGDALFPITRLVRDTAFE